MKKYLQLVADGSIHSYHEDLASNARFRVVEFKDGVCPHEAVKALAAAPVSEAHPQTSDSAAPAADETLNLPETAPVANAAPQFVRQPKARK
ncbi:MAG: hypothetical protein H0W46_04440 [Acidimicrobiia bacterium]|nr:hypothetical protein [Acidimicrobiia bacterium]